jgi:nicotinamidase/pyrazinamidase
MDLGVLHQIHQSGQRDASADHIGAEGVPEPVRRLGTGPRPRNTCVTHGVPTCVSMARVTTVFFDIDTQIDFMYPSGALYVPGAERIVPVVAELNRKAPLVISTMCSHAEDDPEFEIYPHHCVSGTIGQRKPAALLLHDPARQILFPKQVLDIFSVPELLPLLDRFKAERYVVYGVVTEICVKYAAFGLLKTGKRVEIVTDAVKSLSESAGAEMLSEFAAAGGRLITAGEVR